MAHIGRPKTDNPKNIRFEIRLRGADAELLQSYANKMHTNRTNVLMRGLTLLQNREGVYAMDAIEARRKSEEGAIRVIEGLICKAAEDGLCSIDLSNYAIWDSFGEIAQNYFTEKGYKIFASTISW